MTGGRLDLRSLRSLVGAGSSGGGALCDHAELRAGGAEVHEAVLFRVEAPSEAFGRSPDLGIAVVRMLIARDLRTHADQGADLAR